MVSGDFQRKLTAIFIADVVGYGRLLRDDEDSTISILMASGTAMTHLIQHHRGRVVDASGDSLLAEFASVVNAVRCAVEIEGKYAERNAELPAHRRMDFRFGINLGDVVEVRNPADM